MMKTVLITGASSGIGLALAKAHLALGWHVLACGRNDIALKQLQSLQPDALQPVCFDVTNPQQTQSTLQQTLLDSLDNQPLARAILNAGTCEYLDVDDWQVEKFRYVFETNVMGMVHCLAPLLPRLSRGSELVLTDSLARLLPFTQAEAYGASKAAVNYLARSLEVDLHPRGVRVVRVSPGFVDTPLTQRNTFAMPTLINVEQACDHIMTGLAQNKTRIHFPAKLYWPLRIAAWLPERLQRKVCLWLKDNNSR